MKLNNSPIFVVGVPRSGTTLLAAMLASHNRLSCGPETRFFHFLARANGEDFRDTGLQSAVDFLASLNLQGKSVPGLYGLSLDQLRSFLRRRPLTAANLLSSLTEQFMLKEGKRRWVEKSPEHLLHVEDIRRFFPDSPIIRIVRDPRDVALSLMKVPWGPRDFLRALLLWRRYDDQSGAFFVNDTNTLTIRYEELVGAPVSELKRLCSFLDETYESGMLNTSGSADKLISATEEHKWRVFESIDRTRLKVWKRELSQGQNQLAEGLVGDRLQYYEYECVEHFETVATIYPSLYVFVVHQKALNSMIEHRIAMWGGKHGSESYCKLNVFVGEADQDRWIRAEKPGRWWDTSTILFRLIVQKFAGMDTWWITSRDEALSICSRLLKLTFAILGVRIIESGVRLSEPVISYNQDL